MLRRGLWSEVDETALATSPRPCCWSLMELAPFPIGRLPGSRRAISLHPSGCVLLCGAKYTQRVGSAATSLSRRECLERPARSIDGITRNDRHTVVLR